MMKTTLRFALATVVALGCSDDEPESSCFPEGCPSESTQISVFLPATVVALSGELCLNDDCSTFTIPEGEPCAASTSPSVGACLNPWAEGVLVLRITKDLSDQTPREDDLYAVRVTDDTTGDELLNRESSAQYELYGCCFHAKLTFSDPVLPPSP